VFLYHAVQAGLDAAIVNPAHITPYAEIPQEQRQLCDDLLFDRSEDALPRFIAYYEQHGGMARQDDRAYPTEGMSVDQRLHYQVLHRKKEGIEALIDTAVEERMAARGAEPLLHALGDMVTGDMVTGDMVTGDTQASAPGVPNGITALPEGDSTPEEG